VSIEEMRAKISIILSQPDPQEYYNYPVMGGDRPDSSSVYIAQPGEAELVNERVVNLRLLYAQAPPEEQAAFPGLLWLQPSSARTIAHVAVEIGLIPGIATAWLTEGTAGVRFSMWVGLIEKVRLEPHLFSDPAISTLLKVVMSQQGRLASPSSRDDSTASERKRLLERLKVFREVAMRVQYLRLSKSLREGHNPEINADKLELVSRMSQLGFRPEIAKTLQEIDGKILAATTPLDFKNCIDSMRTVYEEIVEDAAKTGAPPPASPPKRDFQPWNQALMNRGILTPDEGELSQKLYNYLSNASTHRLGSAPEQLRVTKNVVIELALLVLGRVQGPKSSPGTP
jgi:hypothetical protein